MICSKCGTLLDENAKFCMNCGAQVEATPAQPAFNAAEPVAEVEQAVSEVGDYSEPTVALNGPVFSAAQATQAAQSAAPAASAYAAAPNAAQTAQAAQNPYSYQQAPTADFGSQPTGAVPQAAVMSGYIPQYDASAANVQTATVVSGAQAGTAVKKKGKGRIVVISIVSVLVAVIAAAAVFFFTNRVGFLSLIMGKSNYAAMVEGNSIKQTVESIDKSSLVKGISFASGIYTSMYGASGNDIPFDLAPMSETYGANQVSLTPSFSNISKSLQEMYGTNSAEISLSANIALNNEMKDLMFRNLEYADEIKQNFDEIIDYINQTKISATVTASDSALALKAAFNDGKLNVDVRYLMTDEGKAYIMFPFGSQTAIMVDVGEIQGTEYVAGETGDFSLELDEKEVERLLNEIVEIYLENYKSAEIELGDGKLSVGSDEDFAVEVSGKMFTAELDSDKIEDLFTAVCEKIASDDYFVGKIAEYLQNNNFDIDKEDVSDAINDAVKDMVKKLTKGDALVITTIVDNSGNVLGKAYDFVEDDESIMTLTFVKNDNKTALGMVADRSAFTVVSTAENETDGVVAVYAKDNKGEEADFEISYSGLKTEQFCGKDVTTGKFEIGMDMPEDFTDGYGADYAEIFADAKLVFNTSVADGALVNSVGFESKKFGKASFDFGVKPVENNNDELKVPSSVVDITAYSDGAQLSEEDKESVIAVFKDIRDAIAAQNAGDFAEGMINGIDEVIGSLDKVSSDQLYDLISDISDSANEVSSIYSQYYMYFTNDEYYAFYDEAQGLYDDYYDLYTDVNLIYGEASSAEYNEFVSRFEALEARKALLEQEAKSKAGESAV